MDAYKYRTHILICVKRMCRKEKNAKKNDEEKVYQSDDNSRYRIPNNERN